jgi:hypothetical protein
MDVGAAVAASAPVVLATAVAVAAGVSGAPVEPVEGRSRPLRAGRPVAASSVVERRGSTAPGAR